MFYVVRHRLWLVTLLLLVAAVPAWAHDVTVSGNVTFASLDGSSLDHDGAANGVFTVSDGSLIVNGSINCNDDSTTSACSMAFNVSGDLVVNAGGAIYAENRSGSGTGGAITLNVGGDFVLNGNAIISTSARSSSSSTGGALTATVGHNVTLGAGSTIDTGAVNAAAGNITINAGGVVAIDGNVLAGPSRTILSTRLTGAALDGGSANSIGGQIAIRSTTFAEPAVSIGATANVVSQGDAGGAGPVTIDGCGIEVRGLVASLGRGTSASNVAIRSGKALLIDGRDLGGSGTRMGMVRADAPTGTAVNRVLDVFAAGAVTLYGPASGSFYLLNSVSGVHDSKSYGGLIRATSTGDTLTGSGNLVDDGRSASGDSGGTVQFSAKGSVNLDTAVIRSFGDSSTGNPNRGGGSISVRSYSGNVVWTNGQGDVRPVGSSSGLAPADQGSITITACGTINTTGSSFPVNGTATSPLPDTHTGVCSPAVPSLPAGVILVTCNTPPVANPGNASTNEDHSVVVHLSGSDADGDTLTFSIVSGPAHGSLGSIIPTGPTTADVTYTPALNYNGGDSFVFRVDDGNGGSSTATVTITIAPVNDAPSFQVGPTVFVAEDSGPQTISNWAQAISPGPADESGQTVTFTVTNDQPSLFSVQPALASNGTLTFTPAPNANGTANISVVAHDDGGTANGGVDTSAPQPSSITVTAVDDAPVAANDTYPVDEGGTLNVAAPGVLGNDSDVDDPAIHAVLVSTPAHAASFILHADGSFTYVHDGSETTSDSFTYKVSDGSAFSNIATVTITINPVNDAPVAHNDAYNVTFHQTLNIAAPGVLGNDTDVDSPSLTAVLVSNPTQGTLALNPDGSFTYTHTGSTVGTDSFTYKASDGTAFSNIATVTITIINQAPVAHGDRFTAVGNTELRVGTGPTATPALVTGGSVLANDTDTDGPAPLTVSAFDATSFNGGSVSMNPNGTFNYLPPFSFNGNDTFNYMVSDGNATATATVTITVVNRVWYVNAAAGATQSGRSTEPFATLPQAQNFSQPGDTIHVAAGSYLSGIVLFSGQRLIGSGVPLTVGAFALAPATVPPVLNGSIMLGSGDLVTGLNQSLSPATAGITGTNVTGGTIALVNITGGFEAITLMNANGAFTLSDVTLAPLGNGLTIAGGSPSVSAANLDIVTTTGTGILGNAGSLTITAGANGSTVAATGGVAVDLSDMALNVSLLSLSANGGSNGVRLNNTTGSFAVTGSGSAGSGGTIQNTTARGARFTNTGSVSLAWMNFTNAATTNGDAASVCGDTLNGTNLNCNAAIHAVGVSGLSLANVVVNGSAQIGINGNGVSNLAMNNVQVTNAGDETFEHGVQFVNLTGSSSVTNSTFQNNFYRQFTVQNSTGSLTLNVTGSAFNSNGAATGAQGALVSGHGTAAMTVNVQSSTFTNNFSTGYFSDVADTGALDVTVANSTFTNDGGGAITLAAGGGSSLTYLIDTNTSSGSISSPISVFKASGSTGTVLGKVLNNTLGTTGVPGSACSAGACDAVSLTANGSGGYVALVSGNVVRGFTGRGIAAIISENATGNLAITTNSVSEPGAGASSGVLVQSGTGLTDTSSVCADIRSNTISGTYSGGGIRVRNRFPTTTFRLPGYGGAGNDTAAVAAFLSAQNGGATATATINGNTFGGGAACVAP